MRGSRVPHIHPRSLRIYVGPPSLRLRCAFRRHFVAVAFEHAGRGELAESTAQFAQAVRIRPEDATANNALGAALLAAGRPDQSIPYLSAALTARPNYFDAHYNLGNALASQGDFSGALVHFRAAVSMNPEDANAEANLGSAFAETGNLKEARLHYERALKLNPNHQLARENLQQLDQGKTSDAPN